MNATSPLLDLAPRHPALQNSLFAFTFPRTSHTVFVAFTLLVAYLASVAVYRLFFSPLAGLPGPWYAAVSDLWITTHVVRMQQCRVVQDLFDTYGPVVRIGPNKVAFCDATTMRSVYCVHKFDKSSYYKSLLTCVLTLPPTFLALTIYIATVTTTTMRPCFFPRHACRSLTPFA